MQTQPLTEARAAATRWTNVLIVDSWSGAGPAMTSPPSRLMPVRILGAGIPLQSG